MTTKVLVFPFLLIFLISAFTPCINVFSQENFIENSGEVILSLSRRTDVPVAPIAIGGGEKSNHRHYFLINNLTLPVVDDFSADFFKSYNPADYTSILTPVQWFIVNGYPDSMLVFDSTATWQKNYDINGIFINSVELPKYQLVFYNDSSNPFQSTDTAYFWPPYTIYDTVGNPADTIPVINMDTLLNIFDTVVVHPDDSRSIWLDHFVYRNYTMASDPPTIGVATFDGLDDLGKPYDISYSQSYGIADYLTSKPINLNYLPSDSVYLSFYYQPQGIGNDPQKEDSLVLEFYSPVTEVWNHIWSDTGSTVRAFKQLLFPVTDTVYLQAGFAFRFKNYATLSGDFDHWHVDYVRLAAGRSINDTLISDLAFSRNYPSLLKNYTAMPWTHFLLDSANSMADSVKATIRNLSTTVLNMDDFSIRISTLDSTFADTSGNYNMNPLTNTVFNYPLNYTCYSTSDDDTAIFLVTKIINTSLFVDQNSWNDTIRYYQNFFNFYSYDDGTAEWAYGLNNYYSAQLACKFTIAATDTLRGLAIAFVPAGKDISNLRFKLTVWNGFTEPLMLITQNSSTDKPIIPDGPNKFYLYVLDSPVVITGTFFVGFEQLTQEIISVGYDMNRNSDSVVFYNVGSGWNNSLLNGTLMFRPVFGKPVNEGVKIKEPQSHRLQIKVFPNPNKGEFTLSTNNESNTNFRMYELRIINIFGQEVSKFQIFNPKTLIHLDLPPGMYFYKVKSEDDFLQVGKIMIE